MEIHAKLQKLIYGLIEAKREYSRLAFDRERQFSLGEPCSPKQLAKLAGILGKPLPPSYRAFLELHNGWEGFDGVAKLLAVEDHGQDWVKNRVNSLSSLLQEYAEENPFKKEAIPVLLGEDERTFTVLDPSTVRKNGEMDFVTFDLTQEDARFKDFISFLEDDLALTQELIEDEKKGTTADEFDEEEE